MSDLPLPVREFENWLIDVSGPEWLWHVKYLSANDTYAKPNVHQGGPHVGKALLAAAFPGLSARADTQENPDLVLPAVVDSHVESMDLRLIWYNSKRVKRQRNGRDEARLTKWGGRDAAMVEPDATGSLVVMAFRVQTGKDADALRVWRCRSAAEEDYLLERVEGVEPGRPLLVSPSGLGIGEEQDGPCALEDANIPATWREAFPSGDEIVQWVVANRTHHRKPVDDRLMARRDCEYDVFRSIERFHAMPRIAAGFASVDAFVAFAGSLTNRRKSRSGRSLELQARQIFQEETVAFSWTPQTEDKKTPDFIFPSIEAYHNQAWPATRLRMLAAKTTCKDRWRQVINEADRITVKHLLTLQEGVSVSQHREMQQHGVQLVVPASLIRSYPDEIQAHLLSFEDFVADVRGACAIHG
ncbi:MAG: type II restriction endonuclease [Gemmatimonadales bacterium]|nr:type II restriction endonuclease [Gemmatimonadales bacterium]